ncbi:MAG TPA: hypothetical protein VF170_20345 [Planctomycetaceae bacterium]
MSNPSPAPAVNGHANGRPFPGRTIDWSGYPALFQRVAPERRKSETVESPATSLPAFRSGGVREAFLGFCQAALFAPHGWPSAAAAAGRALAAAEAFGFTRDEVRRLGCGLYSGPAALREGLRGVGFTDAEIDAARLVADESGRPRSELAGCLVVPLADESGRLCDFLTVSIAESCRAFSGYRFLDGPTRSSVVAYGLQTALSRPAGHESLVLVDDVLECLLLQCRGLSHVAAVGGAGQHLSPRRWEELARLGVGTVTLAFRRDDRHVASVRDALVSALRARTAPEVFVANPYPGGERSLADVLRRFGKDACTAATFARSLAFHDKDFGAECRVRPTEESPAPPASAEPHYRLASQMHVAELAAALPAEDRAVAEPLIAAVEAAIAVGDFPRAAWLVDGGAFGWPARNWWRHPAGRNGAARDEAPFAAAPATSPAGWYGWTFPAWPAAFDGTCRPLPQTDGGRAVLLALRDWVRRECELPCG